jgi:hypothetical protein
VGDSFALGLPPELVAELVAELVSELAAIVGASFMMPVPLSLSALLLQKIRLSERAEG